VERNGWHFQGLQAPYLRKAPPRYRGELVRTHLATHEERWLLAQARGDKDDCWAAADAAETLMPIPSKAGFKHCGRGRCPTNGRRARARAHLCHAVPGQAKVHLGCGPIHLEGSVNVDNLRLEFLNMKIAMIGTRGVPARYGGFETAVEEIGSRLVKLGHQVVVYTRAKHTTDNYKGMCLVRLPALRLKQLETLSHSGLAALHASLILRPDVAVVFNAANALWVPLLQVSHIPTAVHIDGLEWKREKWAGLGARYYRAAERLSVKWGDEIIADAEGIAAYVQAVYGRESRFIPYGTYRIIPDPKALDCIALAPKAYHLLVARFEPENHVFEFISGFVRSHAKLPLVVVGSAPYPGKYTESIFRLSNSDDRVRLMGSVWDQELLDQLYANSMSYLHGHSVGGTNPSLLRALGAGTPVVAWDVSFNREVTGGKAEFVTDEQGVARSIERLEQDPAPYIARSSVLQEETILKYSWDRVTSDYLAMCATMLPHK